MSFSEELLELAHNVVLEDVRTANQAALRRGVSTAYYALFHLLIDQAVGQWPVERHRNRLARAFKHQDMKKACEQVVQKAKSDATVPAELATVARNFFKLQQHREIADYDNSKVWSVEEAFESLDLASMAFEAWQEIRNRDEAQDFLLQLFLPKLSPA